MSGRRDGHQCSNTESDEQTARASEIRVHGDSHAPWVILNDEKYCGPQCGGMSQAFSFSAGVKSEPDNKRLKDALDISSWSGCAVRIARTVVKAGNAADPCGTDARDQFAGGFSMWYRGILVNSSAGQFSGPAQRATVSMLS
jgi:hypothetical protein